MSAKPPQARSNDHARRKRRPWLWLGAAAAASLGLLIGAWVIDKDRTPGKLQRTDLPPITDPIVPPPLTDAERGGTGTNIGKQQAVRLPKGAWVQVAGPDGRVKQQYTATDIHPLPDKRLSMDQPRAVLYGSQGRVVTMRSDSMTAKVPHRELESGRLVGNVVIRVYRANEDRPVDLAEDPAEVVIEAPEAEFDMAAGEIRVDRSVRVTSEALTGEFEGLSVTLSQDGKSITRLEADRALSPIRIERSAEMLRKRGEGLKPAQTRRDGAEQRGGQDALQFTEYCVSGQNAADQTPGATPAPRAPRANPYLLKLYDNVKVVSTEKNGVITLTGDEMHVLFMMKGSMGEGLTDAGPERPRAVAVRNNSSGNAPSSGAAATGAVLPALPLAPEEEAIVITYAGKLVMEPATPGLPRLSNEEAVRLDMMGKPATVVDAKSDTTIRAPHVSFESGVEAVELNGTKASPASLDNPKFGLSAERVTLNRTTGRGRVTGAGTLRLGKADAMPLNVEWGNQGTFTLEPGATREPESTFRGAKFDGGVKVRRKDFSLDSATLSVDAESEGKSSVVRRIVADGGVTAADLGPKTGRMNAGRVEVLLEPDGEGGSRPKSLVATKGVVVADTAQTLWAESLRAAFVPTPKKPGGAGFDEPRKKAQDSGDLLGGGGSVQLGPIAADGPVELLMKDGTRIWSERMEGNAQVRTARLHGPNVLVVRGNSVMDQMAEVSVQDDPARLSSAGPGRMSYYTDRVVADTKERMARPHLPQVPMMQATWREGLAFTEGAIPGKLGAPDRGLLLLQGAVKVRAARSAPEEEALDADEVHIETLPSGTKTAAADMGQVAKMTALGNVRVQAQRWETAAKTGEPQFFRLQSQRAMYDTLTGLCSVDGSGNILINDPAWASKTPKDGSEKSPFSPNGITKFTWQRSLGMKALDSELTTIALDGSVVMEHVGADDASTGTIAADHLEATVRKAPDAVASGAVGAGGAGKPGAVKSDGAPMLGAGSTLEEVLARGKVVVRTSMYDIEAGELSLNERTQVATLTTTPGRVVTIQKRGEAIQRAQSAVWDMKTGIITIDKARGTIAR